MSTESKTERGAWIGRLGNLWKPIAVILSFVVPGGLGYFVYANFIDVPDVVYAVLPTYELEGQCFSGLVVENVGNDTAHDVRVSLGDLQTIIVQLSVQSDESWRQEGGGSGQETLVVWLDRMTRGSSVTLYLLTEEPAELNEVDVRTEEGPGRVAGGQSIAGLVLPVLLGFIVGGLVASGVWAVFYSRLKRGTVVYEGLVKALKQRVALLELDADDYKGELEEWRSGKRFPPPPTVVR